MLKRLDWTFWKKKGFLIIDLLIVGSIILSFWPLNLLNIQGYEVHWIFYVAISFLIALYVFYLMVDRIDFLSILNFLWIFPLCFIFSLLVFSSDILQKIDYFFAQEVNEFKIESKETEFFDICTLIVKNDTIHFNNILEKDINFKNVKVYKSRFQEYYHLKYSQ